MHTGAVLTHRPQLGVEAGEPFFQVWGKRTAGAVCRGLLTPGCAKGLFGGRGFRFQGSDRRKRAGIQPGKANLAAGSTVRTGTIHREIKL